MVPLKQSHSIPLVTPTKTNATTSSSLFPNLNQVNAPKPLKRNEVLSVVNMEHSMQTEFIFTENNFLKELQNYKAFDILTYTISPFALFRSHPIRRLIYGAGKPPLSTKASIQCTHTHAKLWICYKNDQDITPDVFVGSANATDMTILDIVIKVNSRQAKTLIGYFNLLWIINTKKP